MPLTRREPPDRIYRGRGQAKNPHQLICLILSEEDEEVSLIPQPRKRARNYKPREAKNIEVVDFTIGNEDPKEISAHQRHIQGQAGMQDQEAWVSLTTIPHEDRQRLARCSTAMPKKRFAKETSECKLVNFDEKVKSPRRMSSRKYDVAPNGSPIPRPQALSTYNDLGKPAEESFTSSQIHQPVRNRREGMTMHSDLVQECNKPARRRNLSFDDRARELENDVLTSSSQYGNLRDFGKIQRRYERRIYREHRLEIKRRKRNEETKSLSSKENAQIGTHDTNDGNVRMENKDCKISKIFRRSVSKNTPAWHQLRKARARGKQWAEKRIELNRKIYGMEK